MISDIPIVQATAVPVHQYNNLTSYETTTGGLQNGVGQPQQFQHQLQQQQQPAQYRDVIWAVAFIAHLGVMIFVISANIANAGDGEDAAASGWSGLYTLVAISVIASIGLSSAAIVFMTRYPAEMVKMGLIFSAFVAFAIALGAIMSGNMFGALIGLAFFGFTLYYIKTVWSRIPFAAVNLKTALTAVKSNTGLVVVAYSLMALAFAWMGFWMVGMQSSLETSTGAVTFLLLVSFYWTYQVLCNTIHVTTAGTVGTWWFVPREANGCCSTALRDSFRRATTYSFGSICLGSLLVAVVQALRMMAHQARQNEDMQLLACVLEFILACIQDIVEYFNKWAYVYVGLYGFGYIEAGRNVIQLFQQKGWTVVITDNLTEWALFMMSVVVGAVTGIIGLLASVANPNLLADLGEDNASFAAAFFASFLVGVVFSSILMSVVQSAVNTVIVCFAESPAEFERNHPVLSSEMRSKWREALPELSI